MTFWSTEPPASSCREEPRCRAGGASPEPSRATPIPSAPRRRPGSRSCRWRPGQTLLARRRRRRVSMRPGRATPIVGWRPAPVRTSRAAAPARSGGRDRSVGATRGGACRGGRQRPRRPRPTRERRRHGRGTGCHATDHGRRIDEVAEPPKSEAAGAARPSGPGRDPWRRGRRPPDASAATGSAAARRSCRRSPGPGRRTRRRPASRASRRHGWQWARWRASWRRSRMPSLQQRSGSPARSASGRCWQRRPLTSSSYSSLSRRRARNRVLSTIGRRHAEPLADLAVGEPLELAHDDDPVVALRQAVEGAAQVVERLLGLDRGVGSRALSRVARRSLVGVVVLSGSSGTSRARRVRRNSSMQAFLAIS